MEAQPAATDAGPAGSTRPRWPFAPLAVAELAAAVAALVAGPGCSSSRVTDPERTATEQFLLSTAATEAVRQLSFGILRGRRVYVDTQYFAASDEAFVLGEVRAKLLLSGVQIAQSREEAQVILEVRSGGVGIDRNDYLLGVPAFQLVTGGAVGPGLQTPELAVVQNRYQTGVASVSYVAYWKDTGDVVATSGPFVGRSERDDWWFVGIGPRSRGDIAPITSEGAPEADEEEADAADAVDALEAPAESPGPGAEGAPSPAMGDAP